MKCNRLPLLFACTLTLITAGCGTITPPPGIQPVEDFSLNRYMGTWYEIARLDHSFERGLSNVSATYTLRDNGGVKVLNRGYNMKTDQWKEAEGRAYFIGASNVASLKVSFFGPFYGGYNVIALDKEDYSCAMVCGPTTNYLWILARQPVLDRKIFDQLSSQASTMGFPTAGLIRVTHKDRTANQ